MTELHQGARAATAPATEIPFAGLLDDGSGSTSTYRVVRRPDGVRSLLPDAGAPVLRRVLSRANDPESRRRHLARRGYACVAGAGLVGRERVHLADGALRSSLEQVLSGTGVEVQHLALHFGPPRANRKPVVLLLDGAGRLSAVAKIGTGPVTSTLVRHEAGALRSLHSGPPHTLLVVPELLGLGPGPGGSTLMVQSVVPVPDRPQVPDESLRRAAQRELSAHGPEWPGSAAGWVASLFDRVLALPDPDEGCDTEHADLQRRLVGTAFRAVTDLASAPWLDDVVCAPSHGDWAPQNLAVTAEGRVAVWDWERFADVRPLGYDEAHLVLQQHRRHTQPEGSLVTSCAEVLSRWQPRSRALQDRGLARLLVLDLLTRYAGDLWRAQPADGVDVDTHLARTARATRELAAWTLPALTTHHTTIHG
ncbi:hypothetical protein [Nocardioides sp. GY 10127]|uniref:hypothetical protein n=1 Tax=Nocardioides sp. GY 10127 TaxID=2569762 RepID=UPI0010A79291|nr:hypothetical protein [Nocardioides sp. GY 10127]TIC81858.1 hypothetical protein E8D37_11835 [Nocardioides sp. GY 10127]